MDTVPLTERALIQRINRKLARDGERLKTSRGARDEHNVGHYYTIDTRLKAIAATHCDLEVMAREMGVLAKYERLAARD